MPQQYTMYILRDVPADSDDDADGLLQLEVTYTRSAVIPADHTDPACGGEIEIISVLDLEGNEHTLTDAEHDRVDANFDEEELDEDPRYWYDRDLTDID